MKRKHIISYCDRKLFFYNCRCDFLVSMYIDEFDRTLTSSQQKKLDDLIADKVEDIVLVMEEI